ncbi:dynamin family protein [Acetobacter orientalis]|uniref:dynamin family protein n=1 Tax=Acetobacter orientalis TaxID=146474 RepID=UPI0020A1BAD6|nr:dynamin family protein [Acetobacter orientalis]MCP1216896.1 dynamin family protein [Acetobacter orientalis]MCP1219757.1 dynamin family protein [Acetobacter orientalis]
MNAIENTVNTRETILLAADHKPVVNQKDTGMHVMVAATMSAGKSSFINALLGTEILHSANEATTACITGILCQDHGDQQFSGICYASDGQELAHFTPVSAKTVQAWNADAVVRCIFLYGSSKPIFGLPYNVALYDTPGPNNSQDHDHAQLMFEAVRTIEFSTIFYLLNVTQIGTCDDRTFLKQLRHEMRHKTDVSIYFVLNKVDVLDPDMGESIEKYVQIAKIYLEEVGFEQPVIIPAMAHVVLCARKALDHVPLTRRERLELRQALEKSDVDKRAFVQATIAPRLIRERAMRMFDGLARLSLKNRHDATASQTYDLQQIVVAGGLCAAELLIRNQRQMVKDTMNTIQITHNPFIVETTFLFNGLPPAEGCKLSSYRESRLQIWVEKFFDELSILFNGDNHFRIVFKGIESDFLDIQEAAQVAIAEGMQVDLEWIEAIPAERRLEQIRELVEEARQNPSFSQFIINDESISHSLNDAFNRDFDVYVVATMSSGKSTLINAMLGRDLLPAGNEATTATITRITDNDQMHGYFTGTCQNMKGEQIAEDSNLTLERLREWNAASGIRQIDIEGDIVAIREREEVRLVLTDTPGPNNSQDEEHQRVTMKFIQDSRRNPLILYVLNATQLGTTDDKNLLGLVAEIMRKGGKQSKDRFIFVVNKMDMVDPESGEDISAILERIRQYLASNGIPNPQVYPVSANLTRLIRKPGDRQTRKERADYKAMADLFTEDSRMNMLQYMPVTSLVHRALDGKGYSDLMLSSGLPAVETMVDEYIDKYNLPHRLKRVHDAMTQAITVGLNEATLVEQLDQNQRTLNQLNAEISLLEQRQEKGFDTAAYKNRLEHEGKLLPREAEEQLEELEASVGPVLRELATQFHDKEVSPDFARRKLSEAESTLSFQHKKSVNAYEALFHSSQELIRDDLYQEYQRYISDLFDGTEQLNLPMLGGLKQAVSNISFNLSVRQNEIKTKQVVTGTKEVDDSSWWNPFSWGRTKTVTEYGSEAYVDLGSMWRERSTQIETQFRDLVVKARERIEDGKDKLVTDYVAFLNHEFDRKFQEIMASLKEKTMDKQTREKAIAGAKKECAWIENFKSKLDNTLAV